MNTENKHIPIDEKAVPIREVPFIERRRRRDWVTIGIQIFAVVSWILVAAILILPFFAPAQQIQADDGLINLTGTNAERAARFLPLALAMLLAAAASCLFGIIFNLLRHKRKTDRYRVSLFIIGALSLAGSIIIGIMLI